MKIELSGLQSVFCQGRRESMEDYIFPVQGEAMQTDTLFIVCDGMGGHAKGEVASKLACESFLNYLKPRLSRVISQQLLLDAFDHVQDIFDDYIARNPDTKGMGTTVVLALLNQDGVAVMHCGDSRLYHFRKGEIRWKTTDHTLVNEWLTQGLISEKEAEKHPKSNVITRAIQGKHVHNIRPDVHFITELLPEDYLLLCTDGIFAGVSNGQLIEILGTNETDEEKVHHIKTLCEGNSRDNYSAYLLKIRDIL